MLDWRLAYLGVEDLGTWVGVPLMCDSKLLKAVIKTITRLRSPRSQGPVPGEITGLIHVVALRLRRDTDVAKIGDAIVISGSPPATFWQV